TGRYVDAVTEITAAGTPNRLNSRFYGDIQLLYTPSMLDRRVTLTAGVNNVFNQDPPACFSCTGPNFDPTTYDVPGQFGYLRLSYKM
uniref:hypothetical protein n=1 Tax=Sphingomonas sp. TaxID=28214 RepID=UPI0025DAE466